MVEIPEYLEEILSEAEQYCREESISISEAAYEIAYHHDDLIHMNVGEHDTLDVLKDLRQIHGLCAEEFETYRRIFDADYAESIIEAVALRTLEDFIETELTNRLSSEAGTEAGTEAD